MADRLYDRPMDHSASQQRPPGVPPYIWARLCLVVSPATASSWLGKTNPFFRGLTPLQVIAAGGLSKIERLLDDLAAD